MCMTGNIIYHQHGFVWKCGTLRSNGLSTCITILHIEFAVFGAYPIFRHAHIRIKLPPLCTVLVSRIAHCHIRLSRMGFPHGETKLKTALPKTFTAAHGTKKSHRRSGEAIQCLKPLKNPTVRFFSPSSLSWFSSNTTTIQQPYLRSIRPDLLGVISQPQELWQTRRPRWPSWPSSYCEQCLMIGIFVNV